MHLANRSLEELQKAYRSDLCDDFLPFVDRFVVDHELGGFMCNTDRDGNRISETKRTWFLGRGIWTYSYLYRHLSGDQAHLEVARKAVDFTLATRPADDELWAVNFTRDGRPIGGPDTEIYSDLFVAIGLAQYAAAVEDNQYWQIAKEIALKSVRIYDRDSYGASRPDGDLPAMPARRILGHWMILLWLSTQMLEIEADPGIECLASRCVDAIMTHHHNADFGLINEYINHDLSRPDSGWAGYVCTGHAIETLWMVMAEARRRGDVDLFDQAADRFRRHVDVAWDDVYGGCFHTVRDVDANVWDLNKYAWVQEEVLTGTMMLVEHRDSLWAHEVFGRTFEFVKRHLWVTEHLQSRSADRKGRIPVQATNIDIFHNPRHLMMNLLSIQRMKTGESGS